MYSESDLEGAVAAGALSAEQAAALRNHVATTRRTPMVDEEHFRLLTGFNDIFVAIAAVILLVSMAWIGHYIPPNLDIDGPSPFSGLLVAGAAWGLAEYFTRRRRMALPSILLLLAFVGGIFAAAGTIIAIAVGVANLHNNESLGAAVLAGAAAIAAGAAFAHWQRFKVPITVAAGTAALAGLAMAILMSLIADGLERERIMLIASLVIGILIFLFAMRWDSSDPTRQTRRSDVAFWLHLLAAPMIVHPVFTLLGLTDGSVTTGEALIVILLYLGLGFAALAIDRRALLVSALAYVLYALNSLFREYGAVELSVALTALVIGSALLLLSAFWSHARRAVVGILPGGLQARLPVADRMSLSAA